MFLQSVFGFEGIGECRERGAYEEKRRAFEHFAEDTSGVVHCPNSSVVEHAAVNRGVTGSSPVWGAREKM